MNIRFLEEKIGFAHSSFDICLGDTVTLKANSDNEFKVLAFIYDDLECDVLLGTSDIYVGGGTTADNYDELIGGVEYNTPFHYLSECDRYLDNSSYRFYWVESHKLNVVGRDWENFWEL